jgi:cyclin T
MHPHHPPHRRPAQQQPLPPLLQQPGAQRGVQAQPQLAVLAPQQPQRPTSVQRPVSLPRPMSATSSSVNSSPLHDDSSSYFPRDAIDAASLGAKPVSEAMERAQMCAFIQHTGERLGLPQLPIATAVVFFHRFFACATTPRTADKFAAATACLFLAGKVEETSKWRLHKVLPEAYGLRFPLRKRLEVDTPEYEAVRQLVLTTERAVLSAIAFDLTVQHPYTSLLSIIKRLLPAEADAATDDMYSSTALAASAKKSAASGTHDRRQLAQIAWNFINDSLRTTLCLQYEPKLIALAAVYMASKLTHIALTSPIDDHTGKPDVRPWHETFGARLETLRTISMEIVAIYANSGDDCPPGVAELVAEFSDGAIQLGATTSTGKRSSPTLAEAHGSSKRRSPTEVVATPDATLVTPQLPPPHLLFQKASAVPAKTPASNVAAAATTANNNNAKNNNATNATNANENATVSKSATAAASAVPVTTKTTIIADAETTTVLGVANTTIRLAVASNGQPPIFGKISPIAVPRHDAPLDEIVAMVDQGSPDNVVVHGVPKLLHAMEAAVADERTLLRRGGADNRTPHHAQPQSQRFNPM